MANKKWIWRGMAIFGFILAISLVFAFPCQMPEPDDWTYYYAIKNFSQGKLLVSDELHRQQVLEAEEQGGRLIQYVRLSDGNWAVEKAPGYVFFVVPFQRLGIPRAANAFLALGAAIVIYLLLRQIANEMAACIGSILMLFTPASLIMFNRSYMDTFAATAFLIIGGGLYLYNVFRHKERSNLALLFLAGLFIGWSVVVRYTNLPIAGILTLHFGIVSLLMFLKGHRRQAIIEAIPFCLGIAISAAVLLTYHAQVFGSPFDYGYKHSTFAAKFAWDYIGQPGIILKIIKGNLMNTLMPLLIGFPLLVIAIPGMLYIFEEKVSHWLRQSKAKLSKEHNAPWQELPWPVLLILIGWFLSVYLYYFLYEWTSRPLMERLSYMSVARFYLPGLFPLVIISSLLLAKVPPKLALTVLLICFIIGSILFVKAVS